VIRSVLIPSTPKNQIGFTKGVRRKEYRGTLAPPYSPGFFLVSNCVEGKAHGQAITRIRRHPRQAAKGSQDLLNSGNAPVQGSYPLSHQMTLWEFPVQI